MKVSSIVIAALFTLSVDAAPDYPPQSIYHLAASLTDQAGRPRSLDSYRGHPVLVTMFYGSCPNACPLLIDTMRAVESALTASRRAQLRVLMISIDPEHDTVVNLEALAQTRHIDTSRWALTRTDTATVRKLAAVLNIQYRKLPEGGYNHSSVVTLLSPQGEIVVQSATLGKRDPNLLAALGGLAAT